MNAHWDDAGFSTKAIHAGQDPDALEFPAPGVKIVPAAGAVIGSALSVWDAANEKRKDLAAGSGFTSLDVGKYQKKAEKYGKKAARQLTVSTAPKKKSMGAGGVIALILGVAAAAGVLYAAWQTLRADDELWVADDPLRAPDA